MRVILTANEEKHLNELVKLTETIAELESQLAASQARVEELEKLDWWTQVLKFHQACNINIGSRPSEPSPDRIELRFNIIDEEYTEMLDARDARDLVELADGMADVIVTVLGTSIEYRIDLRPIMDEVNRTNLAKAGSPVRADGKILKPEGWKPPDVAGCLDRQSPISAAQSNLREVGER